MTGAELAARVTAAAAAQSDFERQRHAYAMAGGPRPDWQSWAQRLSADLAGILGELAGIGTASSDSPSATIAPAADPGTILAALSDAEFCMTAHMHIDDKAAAYRALARLLGAGH